MLQCFSFKALSKSLPASPPAISLDPSSNIPRACLEDEDSTVFQPSSTVNLSHELRHALQTRSYNEIWSRIHFADQNNEEHCVEIHELNGASRELSLFEVLRPSRKLVEEALSHAKPTTFTRLASSYFDHSESATKLCLFLYHGIHRARELYKPLFELLDTFTDDLNSITESQCNLAFDAFLKFDGNDNPLPCSDSHNFQEMRQCFSQLKQQLDHRLRKSRSRVRLLHRATTGPLCSGYRPANFKKKELKHISQLDAAAKGTFVLNNELDTIDRRVARLYMAIEGDKLLITLGLERGRDIHPVQEVVKQLRKTHLSFMDQIQDLENHICLCFNTVNKARSLLFQEIHIRRTYSA